ncbi:cellulose biosynthesis cyclic di-GMP-binding regulatory protein BcsB [Clostridium sp.]|uniref:cellulose biosynthesis cyclic di-GMP-binding regulatory protein BcsB n=1 Tax=Clostridium sp. TaxID=1506 RepID=UPI003D6CD36C
MKKHIWFLVVLIFMFIPVLNVKAITSDDNNPIKTKNYNFDEDTTMSGVFGTDNFSINVDKFWIVKECYLNLVFTQSQLLNKDQDTLTVLINNQPIYSINIGQKFGYKETIKVGIPVDKLTAGFNEIKIKTYNRITDKPCADDVNSGNWITIHKDSTVHIDFEDKTDSNMIANYPFPFMKTREETPTNSIILLPDSIDKNEVTGAMILASNFGQRRSFSNINLNIYVKSSSEIKKNVDIIYIGRKDDTSKELLSILTEGELKRADSNAIIKYVVSPYNKNKKLLLIISNNSENLIKACNLLSSKDLLTQIDSNSITVDSSMSVYDIIVPLRNTFSFLDMGYDNSNLEGLFKQEATYNISIPNNKLIKDTSKISIKMRYSQNLDFNRSLMTVYINDIPIGSKKLTAKDAENDVAEFKLPKEVRNLSNYNIVVSFDLEVVDATCRFKEDTSPWAFISNKSTIYLPSEGSKDYTLENYPSPFVSNGSFNNTTVVLPEKPTTTELNYLANIIAFQGHSLKLNTGKLYVIKSNEFKSEYYNDNLIVFGTPSRNKLIKDLNKNMNIKFNDTFTAFLSNDKMTLLDGYDEKLASIQMITSPYNEKNIVMVITASKEEDLALSKNILTDFSLIKKLTGDAALIDRDGNIKNGYFNVKAPTIIEDNTVTKKADISNEIKSLFVFLAFIVVFLIVTLIVFIKRYHRRK